MGNAGSSASSFQFPPPDTGKPGDQQAGGSQIAGNLLV